MILEDCVYRGRHLVDWLGFCGDRAIPVFRCLHPDLSAEECINTRGIEGAGVPCCRDCSHRVKTHQHGEDGWSVLDEIPKQALLPTSTITLDLPGHEQTLNCSILEYEGATYVAYRSGWWNADIWIAELNDAWKVVRAHKLIFSKDSVKDHEDPRLFLYDGRLWMSFTGVRHERNRVCPMVMYCRLSKRLQPEQVVTPIYPRVKSYEKNWLFFMSAERLFCMYKSNPLLICEVLDDQLVDVSEQYWNVPKELGFLRGGAPPVYVPETNEWYCWGHGVFRINKIPWYVGTLFTFTVDWKPSRVICRPVMVPGPDGVKDWKPKVVYIGGAILRDEWCISYGYHDHWCRMSTFDVEKVESLLQPIVTT